MKPTPVACSLRVAASPLKGAIPVARRSRFHGISGLGHFAPVAMLAAPQSRSGGVHGLEARASDTR